MKIFDKIHFLNRKGITIVWLALFLLPLLLMFAGLAIDISYMYMAKNELQVAADAACLAGVAELTDAFDNSASSYFQASARQKAWKFACLNKAAGDPTYLATNVPSDCNTTSPPSGSDLNGTLNSATGDIIIGNWDGAAFNRADGTTGLRINAVKVVAKRTGETPGMPQISVFFGKIFRMIGIDWSVMSARSDCIAASIPAKVLPIAVNEYWLQRDASKRPYPNSVHEYPSSFVRQTNVDGTASQAWGRIFAFLGSDANDNVPSAGIPGSKNMNGYINLDSRSSNHDGSGISWYDIIFAAATCPTCNSAFNGPLAKNPGSISSAKFDASLSYLHNGYPYILPTAIKEQYRLNYPVSNYPIPTSSCPYATIAYFSSSGNQPLNRKYNGKNFSEHHPIGENFVALVYDGTFVPDSDPSMPNAVTILGYILLQIDGYASANPKTLGLDQPVNSLGGSSGNTAYAHAISDIVEPSVSGICDQTFLDNIFNLQIQGGTTKLVK